MVLTDMTKAAMAGFAAPDSLASFYFSSPLWLAHEAGKVLAKAGHPAPKVCVMSTGYAVKVATGNGGLKIKFSGAKLDKVLVVAI